MASKQEKGVFLCVCVCSPLKEVSQKSLFSVNVGESTIQINHQHLRVSEGGTSSSRKLDVCVKAKVQVIKVRVGPIHIPSYVT